ncbi:MAG: DNA internalization-related competence protein ComEC/Rec2 [Onishia taeanensis]|uniref:DNA internalization-related competence protein ComEC/Rec2 n=1 Tax=Onishia taeanensis TaxID=284577 RepID=UPI003C7EB178
MRTLRSGLGMPLAVAAMVGAGLAIQAPDGLLAAWGVAGLLILARLPRQWPHLVLFVVATLVGGSLLLTREAELPRGLVGQELRLEGRILAYQAGQPASRLRFAVDNCHTLEPDLASCDALERVRLSVYDGPAMAVGERWRLTVRLRPPSGFANPGTFDYRAWLWREGLGATGYVRHSPPAERLAGAPFSPRQAALTFLDSHYPEGLGRRWLAALTLGADERLNDDDWALLNASGTTHLVVVSGLHVGLVATCILWLMRGLARWVTPGRWRMAVWPWVLAGAAAGGYAWLAGLEPPALRALIMTLVGLWVACGRHAPGPWQAWWLAFSMVVLVDPLSLWRPGLWLSFLAVAWLILIWQGRSRPQGLKGWVWALVRTQLLLAPLMAAAVVIAFGRLAPGSAIINLLAVPWVSMLMVPLGLLVWVLSGVPSLAHVCWLLFEALTTLLHAGLSDAVAVTPLLSLPAWQRLPVALCLAGVALAWGLPGVTRSLRVTVSLLMVAVPVTLEAPLPAQGSLRMQVYDVGQGQAIELTTDSRSTDIRTSIRSRADESVNDGTQGGRDGDADNGIQTTRLLYDTGPRFSSGFMPLAGLWPPGQAFSRVIVSHGDQDHAGGVPALADHRVGEWLAPSGEAIGHDSRPCVAGQRWSSGDVDFRVLWPPTGPLDALSANDRSCVLLVRLGEQAILITGDAGRAVERRLLSALPERIDVLVAGHHGSRTSSGGAFATATDPRQVIFSAGRDNRFGHPAAEVVRRFRRRGSCFWSTALDGAVTVTLTPGEAPMVTAERQPSWRRGVDGGCHGVESCP